MGLGNTRYMQYIAAITGTLSICNIGLYTAWPSPIVPKIAAGETPLGHITREESSWIVSSASLGFIFGSFLIGWLLEHFGRRGTLLITGIPLFLPWLAIAFSSSIWVVCIARFVAGIAMVCAINGVILYNSEIAEKEIRGRIGTTFNIAGLTGELFIFCIGPYASYVALTLSCSIVGFVFLIVFNFMPESPYYLEKVGRGDEARRNLKRLLRNDAGDVAIDEQMCVIKNTVAEETKNQSSFWDFLTKKEHRKSLVISLGIQTIQQLSGFIAITSYMQTIIGYSKSSISPEVSSIICGLVQFLTVFIAAAIIDKAGRKPLLIISSLGCALALTVEGIYFFLQDVLHSNVTYISWLPTAGIILYIIMRPVGIGTIPYILMGELFPTNIKGHVLGVSAFYNSCLSFLVAKSFESVSNAWGLHVMFWGFALICIIGAFFLYFILPETKGKTFSEIRAELDATRKRVPHTNVSKPV